MGMTPQPREINIFGRSNVTDLDTVVETLNIAANLTWWYWTMFTVDVYSDEATIKLVADWLDANGRYTMNCSTAIQPMLLILRHH